MPNSAPQTPGKVKIDYTPGGPCEISVDGYRLEQHVRRLTLTLDASEKPVITLELLPSSVEVVSDNVKVNVISVE